MPYCQVYVHYVWPTTNRTPFLATKEIREQVWSHIAENGKKKHINVLMTSGYNDHCHCLLKMPRDITLSKIAQLLKGESSHWINAASIISSVFPATEFEWQRQYFVKSVSPEYVEVVASYLEGQELHHFDKPLEDEYAQFLAD